MRPHSLLIALGGVGLTAAGVALVAGSIQLREGQQFERHGRLASERLCRALEISALILQQPRSLAAPAAAPFGWQLSQAHGLVMLPGASAPPAAAPAATQGPSRGSSPLCPETASLRSLRLWADPSDPSRLLIRGLRPASPTTLLLDGHALWPRAEGPPPFRFLPAAGASAAADHKVFALPGDQRGLALQLLRDGSSDGHLDHSVTITLALLGGSLSLLLALLVDQRARRQAQLKAALHSDHQTGLPSIASLERDLQTLDRRDRRPSDATSLLITIHFQVLERQRAFLSDSQLGEVLLQSIATIRRYRPYWPNLQAYRISESRLAVLPPPLPEVDGGDARLAGERLLHDLLNDAREATGKTLGLALQWDDIVITGQLLGAREPCRHRLATHAFGERLAGQDRIAYRMLDKSDERRGRADSAVARQLLALGPDDLEFAFQPILLLSDPGKFGLELLLRFRPSALRRSGTGAVMRLAHNLGVAHRIDDLVLSRLPAVQEWLRNNPEVGDRIAYISVNISSESLATPSNVDRLIERLRRYDIDNSLFSLEITETAATHQLPGANLVKTASERLSQELAFRIYIDDFGSGLSNYRRICEAWYDVIKLDIGLIKGISDSFRLQHYVGSFIKSVHALGKTVIAEGVEDSNDLATAIRLGSDCIQGFRISKPLAQQDLRCFLLDSPWACSQWLAGFLNEIRDADKLLLPGSQTSRSGQRIPLERQLLENWSQLRSYEEFVLLFVNELKLWGLDLLRLSLAFLPEEEDIDCSQYIWVSRQPGEVRTLRMEREFLEHHEHRSSPLHRIATTGETMRRRLDQIEDPEFELFTVLKDQGCSDYLGIRLESRGISVPVLTLALQHGCAFSDDQIQRIESMSSLLSLLFYTFESERAKRLALLDPLTGLANRRSFDSFLRSNIAACRSTGQPLALAMIDIDRFKAVNDQLGHAYGDRALRRVAADLGAQLPRRSDFLARLGGEEFGLIMPDTDARRAGDVCGRMRQAIEAAAIDHPQAVDGGVLTISIGIGLWIPAESDGCDSDSLQQLADDCLYEAKRTGRNRVASASFRQQDRSSLIHP